MLGGTDYFVLSSPSGLETPDGLHASLLDLRAGVWRHLRLPFGDREPLRPRLAADDAPPVPPAAAVGRAPEDRPPLEGRVVVFDLRDGRVCLDWRAGGSPRRPATDPIFLGPDAVGIPTSASEAGTNALVGGDRLEAWALDVPGGRKAAEVGVTFGRKAVVGVGGGRVAIIRDRLPSSHVKRGGPGRVDVVEPVTGATVFSRPLDANAPGVALSDDGRSLLLTAGTLVDADARRVRRQRSAREDVLRLHGDGRFDVQERWG